MRRRLSLARATPPFYWAATHALRGVLWLLARWTVTGRQNIPSSGPLIVICNHLNNADPPILGAGLARRRVRFMAKVELFKFPLGPIITLYGAFPVRRFDADVRAMLNAERLLKQGEVLGMFPEGTRSRTGRIGKPHPGTALIAMRSGATVLPCAITGTEVLKNPLNVLRRPRITVTIGEPIHVAQSKRPSEEDVSHLTNELFSAITALLPPKYLDSYTEGEEVAPPPHGRDHSRR